MVVWTVRRWTFRRTIHKAPKKWFFRFQRCPGFFECFGGSILPRKLTWNPKMEVWKMIFLFNWVIFRFHVNFQGCMGVEPKIGGNTPQIIHLFIGFGTMKFSPSILGGFPPIFGNTHMSGQTLATSAEVTR